jgi:hypothetical protein
MNQVPNAPNLRPGRNQNDPFVARPRRGTRPDAATLASLLPIATMLGCAAQPRHFAADVDLLSRSADVFVLGTAPDGARLAVVPAWQGRVMTSSAAGETGRSFGWIDREALKGGKSGFRRAGPGGEDRLCLEPEGGQFALCFAPGDPFDAPYWRPPDVTFSEPYEVVERSDIELHLVCAGEFRNYGGAVREVQIDRVVRLLERDAAYRALRVAPGEARMVAYETENTVTNTGSSPWTADSGLVTIAVAGAYAAAPGATIVLPFVRGPVQQYGPIVQDTWPGALPPQRLRVGAETVLLRADGESASRVGLSPRRARTAIGSYDPGAGVLTIVQYSRPPESRRYVRTNWQVHDAPYAGEAVYGRNSGEPHDAAAVYELQTCSPAMELGPGQKLTHVQRTFHFEGAQPELDRLAREVLGVSLQEITSFDG